MVNSSRNQFQLLENPSLFTRRLIWFRITTFQSFVWNLDFPSPWIGQLAFLLRSARWCRKEEKTNVSDDKINFKKPTNFLIRNITHWYIFQLWKSIFHASTHFVLIWSPTRFLACLQGKVKKKSKFHPCYDSIITFHWDIFWKYFVLG